MWVVVGCTLTVATALLTVTTLLAALITTLLTGLVTALLTGLVAATIIITRAIAAWLAATRSTLEIGSKALGAKTTLLIVVTIITVGACGANTGTLWSGAYTLLLL